MNMEWVNLVSTVGFPILACYVMARYVKYITDKHSTELKEMREQHEKEISKVTDALNNNTLALQHLADIMPRKESGE